MKKCKPGCLLFLVLLCLFSSGCIEKNEDGDTCVRFTNACAMVTTCCSVDNQCYYLYDGQRYNCDGEDCTEAAEELAEEYLQLIRPGYSLLFLSVLASNFAFLMYKLDLFFLPIKNKMSKKGIIYYIFTYTLTCLLKAK